MSECYRQALEDEAAVWQGLDALLHTQRQAILNRNSERVWESQQRLRELLRDVLVAGQETLRLKTTALDEPTADLERVATALRRQVRDGVRLNNALLRDVCSFLEMVRPLPFPPALAEAAHQPRVVGAFEHESQATQVA